MKTYHVTRCEAEIMAIVWDRQRVTVSDVVDSLERKLAYTTVLTTMRILEDKGIVRRGEKTGRAYTYSPAVSREEVRSGMILDLTDRLFGGSVRSVVLSLLDTDVVSSEDLAAVRQAADRAGRSR